MISNTDRKVQTWTMECGFGVGAGVDLRIVKRDGSDPIVIAEGGEVDRVEIDGSKPNQVVLTLLRKSDVKPVPENIPGVQITFNYVDAPKASLNYYALVYRSPSERQEMDAHYKIPTEFERRKTCAVDTIWCETDVLIDLLHVFLCKCLQYRRCRARSNLR